MNSELALGCWTHNPQAHNGICFITVKILPSVWPPEHCSKVSRIVCLDSFLQHSSGDTGLDRYTLMSKELAGGSDPESGGE